VITQRLSQRLIVDYELLTSHQIDLYHEFWPATHCARAPHVLYKGCNYHWPRKKVNSKTKNPTRCRRSRADSSRRRLEKVKSNESAKWEIKVVRGSLEPWVPEEGLYSAVFDAHLPVPNRLSACIHLLNRQVATKRFQSAELWYRSLLAG
jgi:hypothetical protein